MTGRGDSSSRGKANRGRGSRFEGGSSMTPVDRDRNIVSTGMNTNTQDSHAQQPYRDSTSADTYVPSTSHPHGVSVGGSNVDTRGPSISHPPSGIDMRLTMVTVEPSLKSFLPQSVTRDIMRLVRCRIMAPAIQYQDIPLEMRDTLFTQWMGMVIFVSDIDRNLARKVFDTTVRQCLSNSLYKMREKSKEIASHSGEELSVSSLRDHGPPHISGDVWNSMVDAWSTEKWQKRSIAGKSNRATLPDNHLHTSGSASFAATKDKMEKELGCKVSWRDVYLCIHTKKDGNFLSQRSEQFIKNYDDAMKQKYGLDSSLHPEVDTQIWKDAAGPSKKGRIHGTGHGLYIPDDASSSTRASHRHLDHSPQDARMLELERQMKEIQEKNASFRAQMLESMSMMLGILRQQENRERNGPSEENDQNSDNQN